MRVRGRVMGLWPGSGAVQQERQRRCVCYLPRPALHHDINFAAHFLLAMALQPPTGAPGATGRFKSLSVLFKCGLMTHESPSCPGHVVFGTLEAVSSPTPHIPNRSPGLIINARVGVAKHQVEEERARLVEEGCGGSMPGHPAAAHSHSRGASAWLHLGSLNSAWRQAERAGGLLGDSPGWQPLSV